MRVRSAASYQADKKGIVLTFAIEEGPRYRLGRVEVVSDLKAVDAAALNRYLRTQAGDTYNADAVNKTVEDATIGLAKNGEPFAAVLVRSERVPASAASARPGETGRNRSISSTPSSPANASTSSASTFTATPRRAMR